MAHSSPALVLDPFEKGSGALGQGAGIGMLDASVFWALVTALLVVAPVWLSALFHIS